MKPAGLRKALRQGSAWKCAQRNAQVGGQRRQACGGATWAQTRQGSLSNHKSQARLLWQQRRPADQEAQDQRPAEESGGGGGPALPGPRRWGGPAGAEVVQRGALPLGVKSHRWGWAGLEVEKGPPTQGCHLGEEL